MYFSRIDIIRERASTAELTRLLAPDDYRAHQAVWDLFGSLDKAQRDFLFRWDTERSWPVIFSVSRTPPRARESLWQVQIKEYDPKVRSGERLLFSLRANPVVTRWVGEEAKRHARHDVVMAAKHELMRKDIAKEEWPTTAELTQSEGFRWLDARAERHGFSVEEEHVRVDGYRQHSFRKGKKRSFVRLSTMDFSGTLTVTDPERLLHTLYTGIGPAKGFGCGLLMLRRY